MAYATQILTFSHLIFQQFICAIYKINNKSQYIFLLNIKWKIKTRLCIGIYILDFFKSLIHFPE